MRGGRGTPLLVALLLVPGVLVTAPAVAPITGPVAEAGELRWGFKGGFLSSRHVGDDAGDRHHRTSATGGFLLRYQAGSRVHLLWELLYAGKGSKLREIVDVGGEPVETTTTLKLAYVEVPALAVIAFPIGRAPRIVPHILAGPVLGFRWDCKETDEVGELSFDRDCVDLGFDTRPVDLGFAWGLGAEIAAGRGAFIVEGRSVMGFFSVSEDDDLVNRSLAFTLAYAAPIGRPKEEE